MKNAIKKVISILLVAVMVFGAAPLAGFVGLELSELNLFSSKAKAEESTTSGTCGENVMWEFDEESGELTISGEGAMTDWSDSSNVPWYNYRSSVKSVIISDSVTTIGDYAFYECSVVTSITIPDDVTRIGDYSFSRCTGLTDIMFSDNLEIIGKSAFLACFNLASVTIPDGVTSIGNSAFSSCNSLKKAIIPDSVTKIEAGLFFACISLESVVIGNNTKSIGNSSFYGCSSLDEITIPDGLTSIGETAFYKCSFKKIKFPSSMVDLGAGAFGNCVNLESITLGSITAIKDNTFYGCWSLAEIFVPETVKHIGEAAFYRCSDLDEVKGCVGLESIGDYAFTDCLELWSFAFEDNLQSIGEYAFWRCISIETLDVPKNVNHIGYLAFGNLSRLKKIEVEENNEYYSSDEYGVLFNKNKTELIQYPVANERKYYSIIDGVTTVDDWAFSAPAAYDTKTGLYYTYNGYLKTLDVSADVVSFGEHAFGYHIYLTNVFFAQGSKLNSIGNKCFYDCIFLDNIIMPDSLEIVGEQAFYKCQSINNGYLHLPANVKVIGNELLLNALKRVYDDSGEFVCFEQIGICSAAEDSIAKTYAHENSYLFKVCKDHNYSSGSDHKHSYTEIETIPASCIERGALTFVCSCGHGYAETISAIGHDVEVEVVWDVTCTEDGSEIHTCKNCGSESIVNVPAIGHDSDYRFVYEYATCEKEGKMAVYCSRCFLSHGFEPIAAKGHTPGDWETVSEPTNEATGKRIKKCVVCSKTVEEEIIFGKTVFVDEVTGISVVTDENGYDGEADITAEELFDGDAIDLVKTETDAMQASVYDIKITVDDKEFQFEGSVTVKIPIPDRYDELLTSIYHIDVATERVERMNADVETINGKKYIVFEATHFCCYAIVQEMDISVEIIQPSITSISYGDSIVLHADVNEALPEGWLIKWTASNSNFSYTVLSDGTTCTITPEKSGDTTFTAIVYDAEGNIVSADEQTMTSKAGFFDKIIAFFKKLFGLTKIIPEEFKGMY